MVTETTGMATQGEEGTRSEVQQVPAQPQPGQVLQELGQVLFDVHLGHQIGAQEDALGHVSVQHLELGHFQPVAHQDQFEPDRRGLGGEEGGQGLAFLIGIPVQLAFLHGVLELEPEMGLIEQLVELQDEVAAVGFPQQARLQQVLIGIDGALLGLVVDGAKQSVPVQVPAIDDGGLLLFVMDQQVDEHRVLEFEPLGHVRRQIGEKVHDLGVIFLLADDPGDQALGIQVMAHQLEQFANHLAEFIPGTGLQAQPDGLEGVVEVLGIAEIEQVAILAIGRGDQGLADTLIICTREAVEQHDRAVTIKTGQSLDAGNCSGLQGGKRDGFELAERGELLNRESGF